jgi:hypothetical protein
MGVADAAGDFFYAQTAYVVVANSPDGEGAG